MCDGEYFRETVLHNGIRVYQRNGGSSGILWICEDCSSVLTFSGDEILSALRNLGKKAMLNPGEITVNVHSRCKSIRKDGACPIADKAGDEGRPTIKSRKEEDF